MAINFDSLPTSKPVGSLLPSGFAKATIAKAEMKAPKNPGKDYLNLTLDCVCANGTTGKLWDILVDSDKSLAQYKLMRFITALKLNLVGDFELKDLCKIIVGKQLVVDIGVDEIGDRPRNVVEVFKHDLSLLTAVDSICILRIKPGNIKVIGSRADLLIGRKANRDLSVRLIRAYEMLQHGHYLSHTGLVVGAEQTCAVGYNERSSAQSRQVGKFIRIENSSAVAEHHVSAVVIVNYPGMNTCAVEVGRGVNMRDKTDLHCSLAPLRRRQLCVNITPLVQPHIRKPHTGHLVGQQARQIKLAGRCRRGGAVLVRRCRNCNIFQQPLICSHDYCPFKPRISRSITSATPQPAQSKRVMLRAPEFSSASLFFIA